MNDLVYNEIVATPGYELEFAVGTTYSLDAEAFLAIALSFARLYLKWLMSAKETNLPISIPKFGL